MIAKHVAMRSLQLSSFVGLAKYITDAQSKTERLGEVRVTNCDSQTVGDAVREISTVQRENVRAKGDKTYHLIVSFRAGEHPDASVLEAIEQRLCEGLGFGEHQRISAVHHDTDNLHIHIAINKIHPQRLTIHEPYQIYKALATLCESLEREYGLERDNHKTAKTLAQGLAGDMERHAGVQSLMTWVRDECADHMRAATTWSELHAGLDAKGLELVPRANGFVIRADDGTMVKASTIGREFSKPSLEARLGFYEPPAARATAKRTYSKRPIKIKVDTTELYATYGNAQKEAALRRGVVLDAIRTHARGQIDAAKRNAALRRAAIKRLPGSRFAKRILYAQTNKALRAEIKRINARHAEQRKACNERHRRKTWADWLRHQATQGNLTALDALRAREAARGLKGCTLKGHKPSNDAQPFPNDAQPFPLDGITKKGTAIYRHVSGAVRDDGKRVQVATDASIETVRAAVQMTVQKYGNTLTVAGTERFHAQVLAVAVSDGMPISFADPKLEARRQQLLKERANDGHSRGRNRSSVEGVGQPLANGYHQRNVSGAAAAASTGWAARVRGASDARANAGSAVKPDVGGIGRKPPPESQNRLRTLSQLRVVQHAGRSEVLLPSDVPHHMEQQGTEPVHKLRRNLSGPGIRLDPVAAADQYISEREAKRAKGFDIPKHVRYTKPQNESLIYAGTRTIEGQQLALMKRAGDDAVMVYPVDQKTANRLKRMPLGAPIQMTSKGIHTKGRSR